VKYRRSIGSRVFDIGNHLFLAVCALVVLLPLLYLVLSSLATDAEVDRGAVIPMSYTFDAYHAALSTPMLLNGYFVSIFVTVIGTAISMAFTTMMAYALSKKDLPARKFLLFFVVLTMFLHTGLIPYYLVVKGLGLIDSTWSLIIPSALSAFNVILLKNFFLTIPDELEDAARLDGCSDFGVFVRVVLPLSRPAIAAFALFYMVGYWNSYFNAVMFINDPAKMPLQVVLRQLLVVEYLPEQDIARLSQLPHPHTLKAAAVVLSIIPILLVYPWIQKYFTKGILLGSMKE
jgi:putative aldouronate transport system permease protein